MTITDNKPVSRVAGAAAFAGREFPFSPGDFRRIAAMFHDDAGIALADVKAPLVYSRLVKRLRSLGLESFSQYCAFVEGADGAAERHHMIAALTTNVTRFLREPHHFEHLQKQLLPGLLDGLRRGARLRIWSAGCSSGEEPYSIALSILAVLPDAARFDVKILATDINHDVLSFGEHGVYPDSAVAPLTRQQRADWFEPVRSEGGEKMWQVGESLRALVVFRELNLMHAWPMKQAYQAIFCRNVAIYFDDEAQARIWNRLAGLLSPNGCLYVGHSERVNGAVEKFRLEAMTTYRLREKPQP